MRHCDRDPTSNYEEDLKHSRGQRIFNDPVGARAARRAEPVLLQVYPRDTDEVILEVDVPLYLKYRHWSTLRVGADLERL